MNSFLEKLKEIRKNHNLSDEESLSLIEKAVAYSRLASETIALEKRANPDIGARKLQNSFAPELELFLNKDNRRITDLLERKSFLESSVKENSNIIPAIGETSRVVKRVPLGRARTKIVGKGSFRVGSQIELKPGEENIREGTVKWFSGNKGYGFIASENEPDAFVHFSAVMRQGRKTLRRGEHVYFIMQIDYKGRARAIRVIPEDPQEGVSGYSSRAYIRGKLIADESG